MTYFQREMPEASCEEILPKHLWKALYLYRFKKPVPLKPPTASEATIWMAKLGGYSGRKSDPPPGATVLKRGWRRLQDIAEAFNISGALTCG